LAFSFPVDPYDQYGFGLQFTIEGEDLCSVAGNLFQRSQQLKARVSLASVVTVVEFRHLSSCIDQWQGSFDQL